MSQCKECRTERDISNAERLAAIETEVKGIREDIRESLLTQLKDHGKRIAAIERRWWLLIGYMLGSGLVGAATVKVFM